MRAPPAPLRYGAVVALVAAYLWAVHGTLSALLLALGFGDTPLHDYGHFFRPMGARVFEDPRPVEGFLYTPWAALFFWPFAKLPHGASLLAWALFLGALTAALGWMTSWFARGRERLALLGFGLTLSAVPVLHDLKFGQVSLLLVVALLGCAALYEQGRARAAAACLAFAGAFKLYPLLFLSYFVLKRDARFVLWTLGWLFAFLLVVPIALLGWGATLAFYANVAAQLDARAAGALADFNSQSFESLALRPFFGRSPPTSTPWPITAARYAIVVALLVFAARLIAARRPAREVFLWLFLATPFAVTTSWPHYFVYLPVVVTALFALALARTHGARRTLVLAAALLAAVLSNIGLFDVMNNRGWYVRHGLLFFANLAALAGFVALGPGETRSKEPGAPAFTDRSST